MPPSQAQRGRDLEGAVAVITGAAGGLGRAIARELAQAGARVGLLDVDAAAVERQAEELRTLGVATLALPGDVSDERQVEDAMGRVASALGPVDALVNNAGLAAARASVVDVPLDEWQRVLATNLTAVFLCSRAVAPAMRERRSGRIVNISSLAGRSVSTLMGCHYTAAKAGVLGLTRHLARELAPYGVTVNAVCPGVVDTPMIHREHTSEQLRAIEEHIPVGRIAAPEEVAHVVRFLVSGESAYITGASLDVNGGLLMI